MSYKGDFALGQTVRGKFSTSAAAGSRVDFSDALEAAGIRVYKNDGTTERSSTAGYTVTSGFDSMTGVHHVAIDTSDNTDAGFFAAGNDYDVVAYPDEKVDSLPVAAVLFSFSIENRFGSLSALPALSVGAHPTQGIIDSGTAQSATSTTLVLRSAATFADDTPIGATLMAYGSTQGYWQTRSVTDYVLSTDTATVDAWTVTPSGTITYVLLAGAPASATVLPDVNLVSVNGATTPERSLSWLGLFRLLGAKVAGVTTGGGTTSEVYKGLRNDGTAGKTRITETNDGSNRTARTFDITDD